MCDLLSKHQAIIKVMIFLISIFFVTSVLSCAFSLGKLYIYGKVYLSSFQKRKLFMISDFLEWDMHVLLSKHQTVSKVTNFLIYVLPCAFSLVKLYITGKLYLSGFQQSKWFFMLIFLEWIHDLLSLRLQAKWKILFNEWFKDLWSIQGLCWF